MRVAFITTDNRSHYKEFHKPAPYFGTAPEAVLQGFAHTPDLEVHVVSCARKPMPAPEKLAPNTHFHSLHVPKLGWMRTGYQGCIRAVRKCLAQIQPDIVHGQGTEMDCAVDAVMSGRPNVITLHGIMSDMARVSKARFGSFYWFAARWERFALKRTDGVFCNSRHTEAFVSRYARHFWIVPNAVREPFFTLPQGRRSTRPVLLHVGVVNPNKQQVEMLRVARELRRKHDFEIRFLGKATPENPYAVEFLARLKTAEQEGWARHTHADSAEDLIAHFDEASALVHTPMAEAFGLVLAEAMARKVKIYGFRTGGVPDVVRGNSDAVLVDTGDWAALAEALSQGLAEGLQASEQASRISEQHYHPRVVAARHVEIYRSVLSNRSAASTL